MPMRPSLVRFGLLAAALAVGGSACQAPPEPWPQSVERAPPLPYREPIAVATRELPPPERIAPIIERGTGSFVQRPPGPVTPAIARNAAGEVTLNVVDADLREVVRMVLQDALGVNYVIDPAVQGTVTVQTSEPVQAGDLEAILNAILRVNGAALVRTGDLYRVVPIDAALSSGAPPALQPLPDAGAPGFGIRVVPLRFATAAKMAELLAPFAPPGGVLQVDFTRNVLLLAGAPAELDALGEMVAMFDVDWLAGMSFGLFPLEEAEATELATELEAVFGGGEAGPLTDIVRFVPIERLNAILVISAQPAYLERAQTWIERLDRIGEGLEPGIFVYAVQNGRATDLADVLGEVFGITTATVGPGDLLAPGLEPTEIGSSAFDVGQSDLGAETQGMEGEEQPQEVPEPQQPDLGRALRCAPRITDRRGAGGWRDPGDRRRHHELAGDPRHSPRLSSDQGRFGTARHHAPAGADRSDHRRGHAQWPAALRRRVVLPLRRRRVHVQPAPPAATFGATSLASRRCSTPAMCVAVFNALEKVTDVNVISSPHLLVLDNQTALLQVGDEVPISTQQAVSVDDPGAPVVNSIEQRDTGVILSVTPRVNASGLVFMEIEQETSDAVPTITSRPRLPDHPPAPGGQHGRGPERRGRGARWSDPGQRQARRYRCSDSAPPAGHRALVRRDRQHKRAHRIAGGANAAGDPQS